MIPPYISPDVKSAAERKIFEAIKSLPQEIICLHSLGLAKHVRKRQGEIDFVLVCKGVVLCLEVKGGRISRKDGVWCFVDRYGQENRKSESPFAQASSGMFSLQAQVESRFGKSNGLLFGYGVVFPDIDFRLQSPEWDAAIVYDASHAARPFKAYFDRLVKHWKEKFFQRKESAVSDKELVDFLRGDFEGLVPLWGEIVERERELDKFTEEQYRALDHMEGNSRVIFSGGAGTGKTLLAIEKARREFLEGKKILFLCFNKLLGATLSAECKKIDPTGRQLVASPIHKYFSSIIEQAGLARDFESRKTGKNLDEIYNSLMPELFSMASKKLNLRFDTLVIDEGQDLLNENYLLVIDGILSGGLTSGEWAVFLDPGAQSKLFNRFSMEAYNYLRTLGVPEYKLDLNCRNTTQIAIQTALVSGFPTGRTRVEGPRVEYKFCKNDEDTARGLAELLKRLVEEESVPPCSITVLSPRTPGSMSLLASGIRMPSYLEEITEKNAVNFPKNKTGFCSASAYKGLENNIIILTDIDAFEGDWNESVNYVAMTRAKEKLYVFLNKKLQPDYQVKLKNFTLQA